MKVYLAYGSSFGNPYIVRDPVSGQYGLQAHELISSRARNGGWKDGTVTISRVGLTLIDTSSKLMYALLKIVLTKNRYVAVGINTLHNYLTTEEKTELLTLAGAHRSVVEKFLNAL